MFNFIKCLSLYFVLLSATIVEGSYDWQAYAEKNKKQWEDYYNFKKEWGESQKNNPNSKPKPNTSYDEIYAPAQPLPGFTTIMHTGTQDLKNYVGITSNITREEAAAIANESPEITYFVYHRTGPWSYLEDIDVMDGITHQTPPEVFAPILDSMIKVEAGDVIFFTGEPIYFQQAPGVSDVYIKE